MFDKTKRTIRWIVIYLVHSVSTLLTTLANKQKFINSFPTSTSQMAKNQMINTKAIVARVKIQTTSILSDTTQQTVFKRFLSKTPNCHFS